ncbi:MAG: glutamyl-tRNA synthetase [Verrucomicrobiales bacterium]|jgi:glutamyl-tRNA synthetase
MSNVRVRFAPSPTGMLHVGGARTALFNSLFAKSRKGNFVLRVEDTDESRNTKQANDAIFKGLKWLGIDWQEGPDKDGGDCGPYRQSERTKIYNKYFQQLKKEKLIYKDKEDGSMRFRSEKKDQTVKDLICGPTKFENREEEPDMTVRRPDGSYIFHFVSVVDDIEMGITHVIRGEDHLSNTPRHLDLYDAFGVKPPQFAHIPLILNPDGSKMSKRDRGASVQEYINMGFNPDGVANYLALLGWRPEGDDEEIFTRAQLIKKFKLKDVNGSNARFDYDKCEWFSGQFISKASADTIRKGSVQFLKNEGVPARKENLTDELLIELREKIKKYSDAPRWLSSLFLDEFRADAEAQEKLKAREGLKGILTALATHFEKVKKWTGKTADRAIENAADELEMRKGALMFPCRVAVTGHTGGLSLDTVLTLVGQERTIARIKVATKKLASGK